MASSKKVTLSVLSREQPEGVGARVRRSIGRPEVCRLDECFLRAFLSQGTGGTVKGIWEEKAEMVMSFPVVFQWEKHGTPQLGPMLINPSLKKVSGKQIIRFWVAGAALGDVTGFLCISMHCLVLRSMLAVNLSIRILKCAQRVSSPPLITCSHFKARVTVDLSFRFLGKTT